MNKRELLDRCARDGEERVLLARVLDKLELSQNRGIPAHTPFLSPGEQASVQDLLNAWGHPRCVWTGGYEGAERQVCRFLPDWQEPEDALADPEGPLAALEALFPRDSSLSHRDILGGLMGLGLTREKLGDILMEDGRCQVVVLREALPILLSQWEGAGRWKLKVREIPVSELSPRPPEVKTIRDCGSHAAGCGAGLRFFHLPVQGGGAGQRRPGVGEPPGVRQAGPGGRGGGRPHLPRAGEMRGPGSAGTVQKGAYHAGAGAVYLISSGRTARRHRRSSDMDEKKIQRINELAKKAKTAQGLTPEEKEEQALLRREYLDAVRGNLEAQLNNTYIQRPDGSRIQMKKRKD